MRLHFIIVSRRLCYPPAERKVIDFATVRVIACLPLDCLCWQTFAWLKQVISVGVLSCSTWQEINTKDVNIPEGVRREYRSGISSVHTQNTHTQWRTQGFCSRGGVEVQQIQDRGQRERGSGGGSPLVRGSGGSCNLVQEISFHIVKFS